MKSDVNSTRAVSAGGYAAPFTRRDLRFMPPGKLTPGRKGQRRFACRAPTLRRVPAHVHFRCLITRFSPCRRG
ncbi:hypothetical protein AGG97_18515 [Klebsiella michiganensis]|nr:hypothetical protein AGG97_18515 [Klebsiella michiganensis]